MGLSLRSSSRYMADNDVVFQAGRKHTINANKTRGLILLLIMSVTEVRTSLSFFLLGKILFTGHPNYEESYFARKIGGKL